MAYLAVLNRGMCEGTSDPSSSDGDCWRPLLDVGGAVEIDDGDQEVRRSPAAPGGTA